MKRKVAALSWTRSELLQAGAVSCHNEQLSYQPFIYQGKEAGRGFNYIIEKLNLNSAKLGLYNLFIKVSDNSKALL